MLSKTSTVNVIPVALVDQDLMDCFVVVTINYSMSITINFRGILELSICSSKNKTIPLGCLCARKKWIFLSGTIFYMTTKSEKRYSYLAAVRTALSCNRSSTLVPRVVVAC